MNDVLFHGIALIALLASNVLLVTVGFLVGRRFFGALESHTERESDPHLHREIKGVALSLATLSERLARLELQIGQIRDQSSASGLPLHRDADQKFFKVATKLALQGAQVDEIMELCGLSRGEAELICMLHSSNQVSPSGVAGESIQQLTARLAEPRTSAESDGDTFEALNLARSRRAG